MELKTYLSTIDLVWEADFSNKSFLRLFSRVSVADEPHHPSNPHGYLLSLFPHIPSVLSFRHQFSRTENKIYIHFSISLSSSIIVLPGEDIEVLGRSVFADHSIYFLSQFIELILFENIKGNYEVQKLPYQEISQLINIIQSCVSVRNRKFLSPRRSPAQKRRL